VDNDWLLDFSIENLFIKLVPLYLLGAQEVRVLRQVESDVVDPHFGMVLSVRYPHANRLKLYWLQKFASKAAKFLRTSLPCLMALYSTPFLALINMRCLPINYFQSQ
jgi:hypothetical protein